MSGEKRVCVSGEKYCCSPAAIKNRQDALPDHITRSIMQLSRLIPEVSREEHEDGVDLQSADVHQQAQVELEARCVSCEVTGRSRYAKGGAGGGR